MAAPRVDFDEVNVEGTRNVIDACRARGLDRVIYTASFLALPPAGRSTPIAANDYQRTKVAALSLVRDAVRSGTPIVVLIPGVVYGPGRPPKATWSPAYSAITSAGRLPGIVGGDRQWAFAWVDDVAEAHVTALERGEIGAEYAVGGREPALQMRLRGRPGRSPGCPLPRRLPAGLRPRARRRGRGDPGLSG